MRKNLIRDMRGQYGRTAPHVGPDAQPGMKVIFCHTGAGWTGEAAGAMECLKPGHIYTVRSVDVRSSITLLELEEFPGDSFNSVLFAPWAPAEPTQDDREIRPSLDDERLACGLVGKIGLGYQHAIAATAQALAQTRSAARAEAFEEAARVAETNHERSGWFIGRVIRDLAQKETKP